jgi:hypothetical protein
MPESVPTVATETSLLVHVPDSGVLLRAVVAPAQTLGVPDIGVGMLSTTEAVSFAVLQPSFAVTI